MLYLKSLAINKFKSFSHAELLIDKGFTCIIGPNGSGKSTICDALLFALGENSLKRLRVNRYDNLIRQSKSVKADKLRTAYVRMEFGGDEDVSITRYTRSDGKTKYKVNGKRMKRHEVMELLAYNGITTDETNTIVQGEIASLGQMNPMQLRELIDIASGIREFDVKKNESLKELDKVNVKIGEAKISLSERSGFLSELAAEKKAAEQYMQMSARLKALTYSILFDKKAAAEKSLSEFTSNLAIADSKQQSASQKLVVVNSNLEKLSLDRQKLTKQLSDSTDSMGSTKAKLEAVNIQLAKNEAEVAAMVSSIAEMKKNIASMEEESREKEGAIVNNKAKIVQFEKELVPLEEAIKKAKIKPEEFKSNPDRIKKLSEEVQRLEQQLREATEQLSQTNVELSALGSTKSSRSAELDSANVRLSKMLEESQALERQHQQSSKKHKEFAQRSAELLKEIGSIDSLVAKLDDEYLALMEQKSYLQPRTQALQEKLKQQFGESKGFFGKAGDLCTYDAKYAYALESAGGSRLEYLVVDTIETANRIIEYMKKTGLGRATFIPLRDLSEPREGPQPKGMQSVIKFVNHDPAYAKAFAYIFSNTYLIDNVSEAKEHGIGRYRYVTLDGDIVEPAGVVSGGSVGKRQSLAALSARMSAVLAEKTKLKSSFESKNSELAAARKGEAYAEMEVKGAQSQAEASSSQLSSTKREITEVTRALEALNRKEAELVGIHSQLISGKEKIEKSHAERQRVRDDAVNETVELSKRMAAGGVTKEEIEELESKRKAAENLRISKASMEKENTMLNVRISELQKQATEKSAALKAADKAIKARSEAQSALAVSRSAIELQISNASGESRKVFERMNALDREIEKVGTEKGKLGAELNSFERQVGELKIRRSQVETTLKDLTAELLMYKDPIEPVRQQISEMERESIVLNAKLREFGNVNLRAPELYAEKSKDVEEARARVETLEVEQLSIRRMLEEIESKKLQTFMSTFNDVLINFTKFSSNFFTDSPSLTLLNPKEPFNGGLDMTIMEGKTRKHLTSLSGGEKALVLLILLFSIYMCRPAALYVFDEVDAALDKENAKKLSQLIKQLSANAQFIIVSHNDSLITNADVAIGVVKTAGESKALGLEVSGAAAAK